MNAANQKISISSVPQNMAFSAGADLWVLENKSENIWWNLIDKSSGFLLSKTLLFQKSQTSSKIQEITDLIEMPLNKYESKDSNILLGTSDHFHNKWILLVADFNSMNLSDLESISKKLKSNGIRFFQISSGIAKNLSSRLSTSLGNITFIE